jgi:hypothetical protein
LPRRACLAFTARFAGDGRIVRTEIKFRERAVQILFGTMLLVSPHDAFEDAAFNGVHRHIAGTHSLALWLTVLCQVLWADANAVNCL